MHSSGALTVALAAISSVGFAMALPLNIGFAGQDSSNKVVLTESAQPHTLSTGWPRSENSISETARDVRTGWPTSDAPVHPQTMSTGWPRRDVENVWPESSAPNKKPHTMSTGWPRDVQTGWPRSPESGKQTAHDAEKDVSTGGHAASDQPHTMSTGWPRRDAQTGWPTSEHTKGEQPHSMSTGWPRDAPLDGSSVNGDHAGRPQKLSTGWPRSVTNENRVA